MTASQLATLIAVEQFGGAVSRCWIQLDGTDTVVPALAAPGYCPDPSQTADRVIVMGYGHISKQLLVMASYLPVSYAVAVSLASGITAVSGRSPATIWRGGRVDFGGLAAKGSSWAAGDTIGTVAAVHRLPGTYDVAAATSNGLASLHIASSGVVSLNAITAASAAWVSLDGITLLR